MPGPTQPQRLRNRNFLRGSIEINVLLSFIFGVVFVSIMLGFALFVPYPTPFAVWVFITVLALAAAGVGAMVPGVIHAKVGGWVRAGGAMAFFVLVFFFQPVIKGSIEIIFPPSSGEEISESFLRALDLGEGERAWRMVDPLMQEHLDISGNLWQRLFETERQPLGAPTDRRLVGANNLTNPPGMPEGGYRLLSFQSKFDEEEKCRFENIYLRAKNEKEWSLFSYQISPPDHTC